MRTYPKDRSEEPWWESTYFMLALELGATMQQAARVVKNFELGDTAWQASYSPFLPKWSRLRSAPEGRCFNCVHLSKDPLLPQEPRKHCPPDWHTKTWYACDRWVLLDGAR
jgi:hypothetical protein